MPSEHKSRSTQRFSLLRSFSLHRETFHSSRRQEGSTSYEERCLGRVSTFFYAAVSESHQSMSSGAPFPFDAPQRPLPRVPGNNGAGARSHLSSSGGKPSFKQPQTSWAAGTSNHVTKAMPQPSRFPLGHPTPAPQSSKFYPLTHVPQASSAKIPTQPLAATYLTSPFPPRALPRAPPGQDLSRAVPRAQPSQSNQPAGARQPTHTLASSTREEEHTAPRAGLSNFPAAWEMAKENQRARRDLLHAQAQSRRFGAVQQLLVAEQEEEAMRVAVAMHIMQVCHPTSELYASAQCWLVRTMFSSHPSDDFVRKLNLIKSTVGPADSSEAEPDTVGSTMPPQPAPSAQAPTFCPPGDPSTKLSVEEMAALMREASFLSN